jgi:hypothetical protein
MAPCNRQCKYGTSGLQGDSMWGWAWFKGRCEPFNAVIPNTQPTCVYAIHCAERAPIVRLLHSHRHHTQLTGGHGYMKGASSMEHGNVQKQHRCMKNGGG